MCPRDGGPMSDPFDFDDQLRATFQKAADETRDDGFSERVIRHAARPDRRRFLILGGVGSTGAAFSGTQLEGLFSSMPQATGWLGEFQAYAGPEAMAAGVMALAIAAVAFLAPKVSVS